MTTVKAIIPIALTLALFLHLTGIEATMLFAALLFAFRCLVRGKTIAAKLMPLFVMAFLKAVSFSLSSIDYPQLKSFDHETDIRARRQYLLRKVSGPLFSERDMPSMLGTFYQKEWAIVTLSMTAAALTNIAHLLPETAAESREAVARIVERMLADDIREYEKFAWGGDALQALQSSRGQIGYLGHLNFVLGTYRFLGGDERFERLHQDISAALARRMEEAECPYLETFPKAVFVPDNMVAAASLQLYNRIYGNTYSQIIEKWLSFTRSDLIDEKSGLLCPYVVNCRRSGSPRGSFSGWNSFYLPFVDRAFADEQYRALKNELFDAPLGIAGIREFLPGDSSGGDIDSGPVILGLSTSGTGFAAAGARRAGDLVTYDQLLRTAELIGTSVYAGRERWYAFSPLVGEAIMLAMKTSCEWQYVRFGNSGRAEKTAEILR